MKIKLRGHFSILFQLRIAKAPKTKFQKIDFLRILPICTCKVEKNRQIFTPDFEVFDNWRWKYIKNWLLSLIFSEFHRAVFEKPIIFNFVRFLSWPRDEIQKSVSYIFFSIPFSVSWKKLHDDIWNGQCAMLAESFGPPIKKSTLGFKNISWYSHAIISTICDYKISVNSLWSCN